MDHRPLQWDRLTFSHLATGEGMLYTWHEYPDNGCMLRAFAQSRVNPYLVITG